MLPCMRNWHQTTSWQKIPGLNTKWTVDTLRIFHFFWLKMNQEKPTQTPPTALGETHFCPPDICAPWSPRKRRGAWMCGIHLQLAGNHLKSACFNSEIFRHIPKSCIWTNMGHWPLTKLRCMARKPAVLWPPNPCHPQRSIYSHQLDRWL